MTAVAADDRGLVVHDVLHDLLPRLQIVGELDVPLADVARRMRVAPGCHGLADPPGQLLRAPVRRWDRTSVPRLYPVEGVREGVLHPEPRPPAVWMGGERVSPRLVYQVDGLLDGPVPRDQAVYPQGHDVALGGGDLLRRDDYDPAVVLQEVVGPELVVVRHRDASDAGALRVLEELLHGGLAILGEHRVDVEIRFHLTAAPSVKSRLSTVM